MTLSPAPSVPTSDPPSGSGLATVPSAEEPRGPLLRIDGSGGALRVWLGGPGDQSALEADVREVSDRGIRRLPALAVALGDVARRHKLEVRVIPRMDEDGPIVLVIFGKRTNRPR